MTIRKAVILAAGKGSRLWPLTQDIPKPLLPIKGKPMIMNGIDKLVEQGVNDIAIVIDEDYKEHFRIALTHYKHIANRVKPKFTYIFQKEKLGIAHALGLAETFVDNEQFVLLLGDNYINSSIEKLFECENETYYDALLTVKNVDSPRDYGVVEYINCPYKNVKKLIEKPENPTSSLASMGLYIFNYKIFKAIKNIDKSARGEYEITDAINEMIKNGCDITFEEVDCIDAGTIERYNSLQ